MLVEQDSDTITQAYLEHRPYLVDLAFRMLGDIGAAEDVVQDAFTRLMHTRLGEIDDERGWLIVVTSRLCLDQIRSARSRRELAHDPSDLEAAAPPAASELADPADRVTVDDSIRLALLVLLQRLTPAERAVFVLHDIFKMPFETVARTVGRTQQACRKLATRARQRIAAAQASDRFDVTPAEHRLITERFIAAATRGDLDGLVELLAPDAWGEVDRGPLAAKPHAVVTGAMRVARSLLHFWGPSTTLVSHPGGTQPAVLGFSGRRLMGVLVFTMRGETIQAVRVIADPAQLGFLSAQLADLAEVTSADGVPSLPVASRNPRGLQPGDHPYRRSGMTIDPNQQIPASRISPDRTIPDPVAPAPIVKIVMRPMTKILNPIIMKLAGRPHFHMAAQITHTGRRSGRAYVTPVGARLHGEVIVIPLTFGNQSDWSRNVAAAGGCSVRLDGRDYQATQPEFLSRDEAREEIKPMYSPIMRAGFRMLGIRQFMRLHARPMKRISGGNRSQVRHSG